MPNWCNNEWRIETETAEELNEIKDMILTKKELEGEEHTVVTFNKLLPMPEILRNTTSGPDLKLNGMPVAFLHKGIDDQRRGIYLVYPPDIQKELAEEHGCLDWYSWALKFWGVKWEPRELLTLNLHQSGTAMELEFETPWGPPNEFITALRKRFPKMELSAFFKEEGEGISGWVNE